MTTQRQCVPVLLAACASLLVPECVAADVAAAKRASAHTEQLVRLGDYAAAVDALADVDCAADAVCGTLRDFSYGWTYESWADASPARRAELLGQAADAYRRALRGNPDNAQILSNLANVARRAGDTETALAATRRLLDADPEGAPAHYLLLGDILSSAKDYAAAPEAYRAAVEADPSSKLAHRRLLEAYRRAGEHDALFRHSRGIRHRLPDIAATGFAYSIDVGLARDPALAERALVHWTAVRADLGMLSPGMLYELPSSADWDSAGRSELAAVVTAEASPPARGAIAWWLEDPSRRDAIARVLRFKALDLRASADRSGGDERRERLQAAIGFFTAAVDVAPPFEVYLDPELAESTNTKLDAATDLVALHHSLRDEPELELVSAVSADELEEMTDILFSGKAGAYASRQLAAIQRYHTVLGLIFYETGRFTSGWADNATYQLEHALSVASRIAREDETRYRPLPDLQRALADVYRHEGRQADSARTYLDAAMGYLETDDLSAAEETLGLARAHGDDSPRADGVAAVLAGRQAIASRGIDVLRTSPAASPAIAAPELAWVADPASLALPSRFLDGQRFKALADLGTLLGGAGDGDAARYYNATALEVYSRQATLSSPTDARRLERIDTSIVRPDAGSSITHEPSASPPGERAVDPKGWVLNAPEGRTIIAISPEVMQQSREILTEQAARDLDAVEGRQR